MNPVTLDEGHQDLFDELVFRLRAVARNVEAIEPGGCSSQFRSDVETANRIATYLSDVFALQQASVLA